MAAIQAQATSEGNVSSYMTFLARNELYQTEKPYTTDFPVDESEGAKLTNHTFDVQPVVFHDARCVEEPLDLDRNGFCYISAKTSLRAESATPERTQTMEQYIQEIADIIQTNFPQYQEVKPMDFQVRRRDLAFPDGDEHHAEFAQPSTVCHTDFSRRGAYLRMADIFPDQESYYQHRHFDLINVWRVLKGPNNDWPLALCDYSRLDTEDVMTNDALHYTRVGENLLLHHNESQRWYYLSDMTDCDLLVFRNIDSKGELPCKCVPQWVRKGSTVRIDVDTVGVHAAFHNPKSKGEVRHSIEVRLVAFRD